MLGAQRGSLRRGAIRWQGEATGRLDPADLVARGIVQVLEGRHVFGQLTVEEYLLTGGYLRRPSGASSRMIWSGSTRGSPPEAAARGQGGLTSGGEQQMVAIGARPDDPPDAAAARRALHGARADHRREIFAIVAGSTARRGRASSSPSRTPTSCLRSPTAPSCSSGRVVASGSSADLAASGRLGALYLGGAEAGTDTETFVLHRTRHR